ncbi:MAG: hypothetical protein V7K40_30330 [Nostoc sp.]|uniref:hypothetical protein n=1 Tax=Nostoc sp. TaxID=1180 RepID=UPI002FFD1832
MAFNSSTRCEALSSARSRPKPSLAYSGLSVCRCFAVDASARFLVSWLSATPLTRSLVDLHFFSRAMSPTGYAYASFRLNDIPK